MSKHGVEKMWSMQNRNSWAGVIGVFFCIAGTYGCVGDDGKVGPQGDMGPQGVTGGPGPTGPQGSTGFSCSVVDNLDGTKTISCEDGTQVIVSNGTTGDPGLSCTVVDNLDGTKTISCEDGTVAIVNDGANGASSFHILAEVPKKLGVTITSVSIASPPVVNFRIQDVPAGRGAVGLLAGTTGQLRFNIAKLVPGLNGDPDTWQNYINVKATACTPPGTTQSPCPNVGQIGGEEVTQATTERNGNLVDHGDGNYTYTFAKDLANVTDPVTNAPIPYDPTLTHRVSIQMSGTVNGTALPPANGVFDFVPNGSPISLTRDIVMTASCNECHGKLALHGGGRVDTEYCVTCHNPGSSDPETGNSVNMPYMVHAIHGATKRAEQGLPAYEVVGFGGALHDYSEVTYPQAITNCLKCHNGADVGTPQGNNWEENPNREACSGCHDVDAAGGGLINHVGIDNNSCGGVCHGPTGSAAVAAVHQSEDATPNTPQVIPGAFNFTYEIRSVVMADATHPTIEFRIKKDGVAMADLTAATLSAAPLYLTGGPSFLLAYALPQDGITIPADWNNLGRNAAQPQSISLANIIADTGGTTATVVGPDVDGYFQATLKGTNGFPAGALMRTVALQGYWSQSKFYAVPQFTGTCPTAPAPCNLARHAVSIDKTVAGDTDRRSVVDSAKCGSCHEWFLGHGGNRVYNTDVCVMCHVPNLSSSGRGADPATVLARMADSEEAAMTAAGYTPADPLTFPEEGMGFKTLIHGIHSSEVRTNHFDFVRDRGASGVYYYDMAEVTFPGVLNNCETCHKPGTYDIELPDGVMNSTDAVPGLAYTGTPPNFTACTDGAVDESSFNNIVAARSGVCLPNDVDIVTTPVSATCNGCHTSALAELHMVEHGAYMRERRDVVNTNSAGLVETCALCHGPGRLADVAIVHVP